jgi:acyl carrier protein
MVLEKITEIIVNTTHCKAEDVTPEAELAALGVDSLKAITVIFELEEAFDIEIPNEVIASIITVKDILDRLDGLDYNPVHNLEQKA